NIPGGTHPAARRAPPTVGRIPGGLSAWQSARAAELLRAVASGGDAAGGVRGQPAAPRSREAKSGAASSSRSVPAGSGADRGERGAGRGRAAHRGAAALSRAGGGHAAAGGKP